MWSRADWKRGRWNVNTETTLLHRGLRAWQRGSGDSVVYWRLEQSVVHDVYDEATGSGKGYYGPWTLPVLHATHVESATEQPHDGGMYVVDRLDVVAEWDQLARVGMTRTDLEHGRYQRDRLAYDNLLWRIDQARVLGQVRRRDTVVALSCTRLMPDELVNDPIFANYLSDPNASTSGGA